MLRGWQIAPEKRAAGQEIKDSSAFDAFYSTVRGKPFAAR
jgi:hypothetical protein